MTEPNHARLLDPRWHQIADAARQFYEQLEPGDQVAMVSTTVVGADGQIMAYALVAGESELHRHLVTDLDAVAQAMRASSVDLTPEAGAA